MGRKPQFSADEILDAALELVVEGGPAVATASAVARRVGAPSGSVYHRFASRDELMARLWLRSIAQYQEGIVTALSLDDVTEAAQATVAHCFDWTAAHPGESALLLQYDKQDLLRSWPDTLAAELRTHNHHTREVVRAYARRRFGSSDAEVMDRVTFALVDLPYAAVRRHLPDRGRPAEWLRDFTLRSAEAILAEVPTRITDSS
ncbi:TetR/AcrR family transcriptional regulator [Gordonia tangerina]|uniref:TetR/AcrR family transcriptional regulator n=1 Tax=Gordonia tangerina TaxID=2911060 RepID=A0ABS9DPP7_9ACTN|nr:TetR/AcrR family transcriptional regulator [Gordonia tangerina]MCF3941194.1 TetR/AcrR family transcriptional regulator [Gordonia tangerina]